MCCMAACGLCASLGSPRHPLPHQHWVDAFGKAWGFMPARVRTPSEHPRHSMRLRWVSACSGPNLLDLAHRRLIQSPPLDLRKLGA